MTDRQALQEAKDRWGKDVRIEKVSRKKSSRRMNSGANAEIECRVGMIKMRPEWGEVFDVKGIGQTWEEAFKYADRQKPVS